MIAGIVLAGGRSARMGRPKALLSAGDRSFVEAAIGCLIEGGCSEVIVVVNEGEAELMDLAARAGGVLTWGAGPDTEQIDSLIAGVKALPPEVEAAVVLPVDHPRVKPQTVAAMIRAFAASHPPIIQLRHQGRHGHPVLFAAPLFDELKGDLPEGARTVIDRHRAAVHELDVDDPGILLDVDTPDVYEQEFGDAP